MSGLVLSVALVLTLPYALKDVVITGPGINGGLSINQR